MSLMHIDWNAEPIAIVTTTLASEDDARRLAQGAVQMRLAACAQVESIMSHYEWHESLEAGLEWRLVFKTLPSAAQALLAWVQAQHPYAMPQLLLRMEQANADYASWVGAQLQKPLITSSEPSCVR